MSNQLVVLQWAKPSAMTAPPLIPVPTAYAFQGNGTLVQCMWEFSQHYLIETLGQPFFEQKPIC